MLKVIILLMVVQTYAQRNMYERKCKNVYPMKPFDYKKFYYVRWYELERTKNVNYYKESAECTRTGFYPDEYSDFNVVTEGYDPSHFEWHARGEFNSPGNYTLTQLSPGSTEGRKIPYYIVGTDYENYAVTYSCEPGKIVQTKRAWILVRSRGPVSKEINDQINVVFKKNSLMRSRFKKIKQSNCPN